MPLLEILKTSSLYSGQRLQSLIGELEKAVSSGKAAGEFQVNYTIKFVALLLLYFFFTLFRVYNFWQCPSAIRIVI